NKTRYRVTIQAKIEADRVALVVIEDDEKEEDRKLITIVSVPKEGDPMNSSEHTASIINRQHRKDFFFADFLLNSFHKDPKGKPSMMPNSELTNGFELQFGEKPGATVKINKLFEFLTLLNPYGDMCNPELIHFDASIVEHNKSRKPADTDRFLLHCTSRHHHLM
ncbi:hypothetical protein PMAYCL1PPCAC_21278, partial [Pristionchus mayeri]